MKKHASGWICKGGFIALLAQLAFFSSEAMAKGKGFTINPGVNRTKLDPQPDYVKTMKEGAEKVGASVQCTSGFRSEGDQKKACRKACGNENGCKAPNNCAPPGKSNHQKVATCDLKGLPGSAEKGCDFLFEMCQQMRSRDNSLQCEIGGYGPGGHHLAVGKGIRPSAYTKCKHLKSKMGMDPGRDKRLQDDANKLQDEIMGNNPPKEQQAGGGAPQMPSSGGGSPAASNAAGSAQYPQARSGATSPTPEGTKNRVGEASREGSSGGTVEINIPPGLDPSYSDVTKRADGEVDSSGITGGANNNFSGGVAGQSGGSERSGREFTGASLPSSKGSIGSGIGAGIGGSDSGSGKGGDKSAPGTSAGNGAAASSEVLSTFSGGGGGGGKLGSSLVSLPGSDIDAAVKNLATELGHEEVGERYPASEKEGISEAEGESLFGRAHGAHVRCLRRDCVSFGH